MSYSGDLTPHEFGVYIKELHPAVGAMVRFHPVDRLGIRLGFNTGRVSGDDVNSNQPERGLSFQSDIIEASLLLELETFRLGNVSRGTYFAGYIYGGGGFYRFDPETLFEDDYIALQPIGTEGQGLPLYENPYQLTQVNVPVGFGFKYVFDEKFAIAVEFGGRKLFTDYLDDIGHVIVNYSEIQGGKGDLAAEISYPNWEKLGAPEEFKRGGDFDDWYYVGGLTLTYFLNGGGGSGRSRRSLPCYSF